MQNVLPADFWIPPLLRFYDKYGENKLLEFLEKLDNKFSYDWIIGQTPTSRIENMNNLIKVIDKADPNNVQEVLQSEVFKLNLTDFNRVITDNVYGRRFARYILYKLDYLYGDTDKINVPKIISVEHILPQNPENDSQWKKDFSDEERELWLNKIGNLVLISRRKNSSQGRKDYLEKKEKYFIKNIELFRNSLRVYNNYSVWNPAKLEENQNKVINKITEHYKLNE